MVNKPDLASGDRELDEYIAKLKEEISWLNLSDSEADLLSRGVWAVSEDLASLYENSRDQLMLGLCDQFRDESLDKEIVLADFQDGVRAQAAKEKQLLSVVRVVYAVMTILLVIGLYFILFR